MWIFPRGTLCSCPDVSPGQTEPLTEKIDVIDYCPKGKIVFFSLLANLKKYIFANILRARVLKISFLIGRKRTSEFSKSALGP